MAWGGQKRCSIQYSCDDVHQADGYANVKQDILKTLQDIFGADFIVGVSFPSVKAQ